MQNDILFGILLTLIENKKTTAAKLAEKFELSKRTIFRYLDTLNMAGVPIVTFTGAGGGVALAANFKMDKMYFTEKEYDKILSALAQHSQDPIAQKIIQKFSVLSKSQNTEFLLRSSELFVTCNLANNQKQKIEQLRTAMDNCLTTSIVYHSRKNQVTTREILPHAFVVNENQWYTYAFCTVRNDFRLFKLSRMEKIDVTSQSFQPMILPSPLNHRNEDGLPHYPQMQMKLKIQQSCRLDAEEWLGIENVTAVQDFFEATVTLPHSPEVVSKLLSFGDGIQVLEPNALKKEIMHTAQKTLSLYTN